MFGETGELPGKFDVLYAPNPDDTTSDALDSEADAISLIDQALDALSSNANLEAAVRPDGTGIFSYWNTGNPDNADTPEREDRGRYVIYNEDADSRRWEFITGALTATGKARTIGNFRGEKEYKVIAAMGTTDYTRFGIWRREDTSSARRNDGGTNANQIRDHGGPGTFAYSPLDPTNVGTLANLSFPVAGSATYTGETVALQLTTVLTGMAQVDVKWGTPASVNADTEIGTMSLTISDLASAAGDPLSQGGAVSVASDGSTTGNEIADIVFPDISIVVGNQGAFANKMIAGNEGTADDDGNFSYSEAPVTGGRYRLATGGGDVNVNGTATVQALFVGQGVDGPLGVIGTWTLDDATVGRIADTGDHTDDLTAPIYGAFGAQAP